VGEIVSVNPEPLRELIQAGRHELLRAQRHGDRGGCGVGVDVEHLAGEAAVGVAQRGAPRDGRRRPGGGPGARGRDRLREPRAAARASISVSATSFSAPSATATAAAAVSALMLSTSPVKRGEDASLLNAERRGTVVDGQEVDLGHVGEIVSVN
jgi:hypothetical protein